MRRVLLAIIKIIMFVASFACAVWFFMPWREVGSAAMVFASRQLEKQGLQLNFSDVTAISKSGSNGSSGSNAGFVINNLTLSSFMTINCGSLTIKPQLAASVLSLAPVCSLEFKNANIAMGQNMNFGDGGFLLTAQVFGPREILLEKLHSKGDFAVNGFMAISTSQMKISRADAALRIPENFESNMSTLQAFLPLTKQGDNWFLRRN